MDGEPIEISYEMTEDELVRVFRGRILRAMLQPRRFAVFAAILALSVIAFVIGQGTLGSVVAGIFVGVSVVPFVLARNLVRRTRRQNPVATQARHVVVSASGIDVTVGPTSTHIEWSGIDSLTVEREFILVARTGVAVPMHIPRRVFESAAAQGAFVHALTSHGVSLATSS